MIDFYLKKKTGEMFSWFSIGILLFSRIKNIWYQKSKIPIYIWCKDGKRLDFQKYLAYDYEIWNKRKEKHDLITRWMVWRNGNNFKTCTHFLVYFSEALFKTSTMSCIDVFFLENKITHKIKFILKISKL